MDAFSFLVNWLNNARLPTPRQIVDLTLLGAFATPKNDKASDISHLSTCPSPELSCPIGSAPLIDGCCGEGPLSGHFLATQFWDTAPVVGPEDSWTLHGLWPDHCTGGFEQFCNSTRSKSPTDLEEILLLAANSTHPALLPFMKKYWLSMDHRDSNLWAHEWNKHGTCISTLKPDCYESHSGRSQSSSHQDVLDYFTQATNLFSKLNTYKFLKEHDIVPDYAKTYALADLELAIRTSSYGQEATLRCNHRGELDEVWYHFLVRGPMRDATSSSDPMKVFVPTKPDGQISNCPSQGIKYLPKTGHGSPRPTHTWSSAIPGPTSPSTPFEGKGHLKVYVLANTDDEESASDSPGSHQGCLIRHGTWYRSGACARYTAKADVIVVAEGDEHLFTLESSFAPCAILLEDSHHGKKGQFVCARNLPIQTIFTAENRATEDGDSVKVLSYNNQTVFYAAEVAQRFKQVPIFDDDHGHERSVRIQLHWESV